MYPSALTSALNASADLSPPGGEEILPRAGFVALAVVMALFTGPAIVLNATVIIVTLANKGLRRPLNYALVNMAVADLGSALSGGVLSVVNNAAGRYSMGRTGCVVEGFAVSLFGITSLCTVALIAVERMFVVSKPLGRLTFQTKHAFCGVALSWLWSLAWNTPPLFGWGRYEPEGVGTSCAPDWRGRDPGNVSYLLCYLALCFAVPFAVIVGSYAKLLWTLRQVAAQGCVEGGAAAKAEVRVARMVVLMVLAFLVSWLPYASLALLAVLGPGVAVGPLVGTVPVYLAKSSTVYNPLIYIFLNKQFRSYAVPFLLCGKNPWATEEEDEEETTVVASMGPVNNKVST